MNNTHGWAALVWEGFPAWHKQWADGSSLVVAEQGAQVLSWKTADGREHLYLSPASARDGKTAIRGGVPVCFPQFNTRGPLPKHGFVRNLGWQVAECGAQHIALRLQDGPATRQFWPEAFDAVLRAEVGANSLAITLEVRNTGSTPWAMTCALHSYLQVDDITQTQLSGLQGAPCWDALANTRFAEAAAQIDFGAAPGAGFDRVFSTPGPGGKLLQILQLSALYGRALAIQNSKNSSEVVVWNPGAALSQELADMPDDGWRQMLCVEAASIDTPVTLAPGQSWRLMQTLTTAGA